MELTLESHEKEVLRHALEVYLSDLRGEIVKTEKVAFKLPLKDEEKTLKQLLEKLGAPAPASN